MPDGSSSPPGTQWSPSSASLPSAATCSFGARTSIPRLSPSPPTTSAPPTPAHSSPGYHSNREEQNGLTEVPDKQFSRVARKFSIPPILAVRDEKRLCQRPRLIATLILPYHVPRRGNRFKGTRRTNWEAAVVVRSCC